MKDINIKITSRIGVDWDYDLDITVPDIPNLGMCTPCFKNISIEDIVEKAIRLEKRYYEKHNK